MTPHDMTTPDHIIAFWINETGPEGWYNSSQALDDTIRRRFLSDWQRAKEGKLDHWQDSAKGALAFLILTDQFARNMFRGDDRSFATDAAARDCARHAIKAGFDRQTTLPARQFFYLPFMHSEDMADQDLCVALMGEYMSDPQGQGDTLHARAHREVIRQFGRFPYRNDALGRKSTPEEQQFLSQGGYGQIVAALDGDTGPQTA